MSELRPLPDFDNFRKTEFVKPLSIPVSTYSSDREERRDIVQMWNKVDDLISEGWQIHTVQVYVDNVPQVFILLVKLPQEGQ